MECVTNILWYLHLICLPSTNINQCFWQILVDFFFLHLCQYANFKLIIWKRRKFHWILSEQPVYMPIHVLLNLNILIPCVHGEKNYLVANLISKMKTNLSKNTKHNIKWWILNLLTMCILKGPEITLIFSTSDYVVYGPWRLHIATNLGSHFDSNV